jgi:hypothetical protein
MTLGNKKLARAKEIKQNIELKGHERVTYMSGGRACKFLFF